MYYVLTKFREKNELEQFMDTNNIYLDAIPEEVNLLGMFHTLLHTEENSLKVIIFQHSECKKKLKKTKLIV